MAKAVNTITTPLFVLFSDPDVRSAFYRAARDQGATFAIPADRPRVLTGGAAERLELVEA
jgi:hypothetical protein